MLDHVNLNSSRSDKVTVHLDLSLAGSGLTFEPGDALMLVPENDPAMVDQLLAAGGINSDEAFAQRLRRELDVTTLSRATLEAYQRLRPQDGLDRLLEGENWREFVAGRQIVDLLEAFPSRLEAEELICVAAAAAGAGLLDRELAPGLSGRSASADRSGRLPGAWPPAAGCGVGLCRPAADIRCQGQGSICGRTGISGCRRPATPRS